MQIQENRKEVKLLDWQEELYRWEAYAEKFYPLRDEIAGIFETKCFYDDKYEYHEKFYVPNEDTVFMLKLSKMLNDICEFIKFHIAVLEQRVRIEEEQRANLEQDFEAWKRGWIMPQAHENSSSLH